MLGSFVLFGREIGFYSLMALIGALTAGAFAYRRARRDGLNEVTMVIMLLFSAIGIVIGGHLLYGITNLDKIILFSYVKDLNDFFAAVSVIFGGQVFYGGLIGGAIAAVIYARVTKLSDFGGYTDIMAAGVPLFHCFGRVGCFLGGCCYGVECSFGVTFHRSIIEAANGVPRFPVQLLEAAFNLALFFLMLALLNKGKLRNRLFILYLALYAVGRFAIEFLRGDTYRGFFLGLSTSQIVALLMLLFCAGSALVIRRRKA